MFILHVYFAISKALNILVCTHTVNNMLRAVMATRLDGESVQYLDSFETLRDATNSFVMSVRPRGITRFRLEGFSCSFVLMGSY
jgi:hypothetical protein